MTPSLLIHQRSCTQLCSPSPAVCDIQSDLNTHPLSSIRILMPNCSITLRKEGRKFNRQHPRILSVSARSVFIALSDSFSRCLCLPCTLPPRSRMPACLQSSLVRTYVDYSPTAYSQQHPFWPTRFARTYDVAADIGIILASGSS